ncbi:MAG: L,D-transpeptidase family protein [bacterium]
MKQESQKKDKNNVAGFLDKFSPKEMTNLPTQPMINYFGGLRKSSALIMGTGSIIAIILLYFFLSPFLVRIKIGNINVTGGKSTVVYMKAISGQVDNYRISVEYSNKVIKKYTLSDVGVSVNYPETIKNLHQASYSISNRLQLWRVNPVRISYSVNQKTLAAFNKANLTQVIEAPKNASISLSGGAIVLADSSSGKEYAVSGGPSKILNSAESLSPTIIKLQIISLSPAISTAQLSSQEPEINKILAQRVVLNVAGTSTTVSSSVLSSWLSLSVNPVSGKISTEVNKASVIDYMNKIAYSYTRPVKDQIVMNSVDGSSSVIVPGQNGIAVSNVSGAAQAIINQILGGQGVDATIVVSTAQYQTITTADYPKWIEVNVSTKRMYAYENANLVNSFLVSAGKSSTPTPIGQFHILSKFAVQTMVGADYVQPNVPWINYFKSGGYAIHGNYWRPSSWFGNINSSHGCVGLQVGDAEWIYNWAPIGTPIIIHT